MNTTRTPSFCVAALLAIAISAVATDSRADQLEGPGQLPRWEYKIEAIHVQSRQVTGLNRLGNQRWELVQVVDGLGIFKRIKTAPDETTPSGVQIELKKDLGVVILRGKKEDVKKAADAIRKIEQLRPKSSTDVENETQIELWQPPATISPYVIREKTRYEGMGKEELKAELRRLQEVVLDAARSAAQARDEAAAASRAYLSAPDEEKADALLAKIEADAASRPIIEHYRLKRQAFEAAQQAYVALLVLGDKAALAPTEVPSDAVERGMKIDAIERQQLFKEIVPKPLKRVP